MDFLSPNKDKFVLTYALFAVTILLAAVSAVFASIRPFTGGLVAFLTFPANAFIQFISGVRMPAGATGDFMLLLEFAFVLALSVAYLYVVSSVLFWIRDVLPKSRYRVRN